MDYSRISQGRKEAFQRFGSIYQLPIVRSAYDYLKHRYEGGTVLDVGAGKDLYIRQLLALGETTYFSLDNDPSGVFTYQQVEDIADGMRFDWMILNQVLEHLTLDSALNLLRALLPHLHADGRMLITVPNVFHPIRYWADPTHMTALTYAALYALCCDAGYQVLDIYRYSKNRGPLDPLSWVIERVMRHLYRIDWCDSILLIATR